MSISPGLLTFLSDLKANNSREWFAANKALYDLEKGKFDELIESLIV
jgi:uncharacterized protein (DUF2461 family)